jgi:hypothetical protein
VFGEAPPLVLGPGEEKKEQEQEQEEEEEDDVGEEYEDATSDKHNRYACYHRLFRRACTSTSTSTSSRGHTAQQMRGKQAQHAACRAERRGEADTTG